MNAALYRKAIPADIETIVRFQLAMAYETEQVRLDPEVVASGVRAVFEAPSLGQYHVGERNGRVVGSALVTYEWSDWRNGVVWWLQSVFVIPEVRRQRVFSGLYSYITNLAQADAQVRGIRLYVDRRNAAAQQVYTRLGMDGGHYQVYEWMKP